MKQSTKSTLIGGASVVAVAGMVLIPAAAFAAADSANTTIQANIASTISISTSGTVSLNITPTGSGAASSSSDTVTVSTNRANGYYLQLADADATNTLVNGGNTIAATSGSFGSPAAISSNSWGFRVDGAGTFGAGPTSAETNQSTLSGTWAAVPVSGSPVTIKTTATTATNETTTVWYGAKVDTSKPDGTYSDTVTYTATTNT